MLYFWKAECSRMSNMTFPCVNTIQLGPSPFNSSPQCKKSSLRYHFSRNSWKFGSQKLLPHGHFWWGSRFSFFSLPSGPRGMFEPIVTNSDTSNTRKHPQNTHKEWCYNTFVKEWMKALDKNFGTFGLFLSFFVSELRPFKVKTNFSNVFLRPCSSIPSMHCS